MGVDVDRLIEYGWLWYVDHVLFLMQHVWIGGVLDLHWTEDVFVVKAFAAVLQCLQYAIFGWGVCAVARLRGSLFEAVSLVWIAPKPSWTAIAPNQGKYPSSAKTVMELEERAVATCGFDSIQACRMHMWASWSIRRCCSSPWLLVIEWQLMRIFSKDQPPQVLEELGTKVFFGVDATQLGPPVDGCFERIVPDLDVFAIPSATKRS